LQLSEEQILALAPDESSMKSGRELANASKWITKGASEAALWGECQGSGSKPYQTQIDLSNIAFKCSCPSRKFPCKHGMGLLLLYARQPKSFALGELPLWVAEWINRRGEKSERTTSKKDKPVDEVAQARRQQAREQKVTDGIDELLLWIKDIIRNGILNIPEKSTAFWENIAKRMVDAQAPGLSGMVRELSDINFYKERWETKFLDRLVRIYLVIKAYKNIAGLPVELQDDIRNLIGFTQNQDELKAQEGVKDDWFVLGKQSSHDEQLTVERNWLFGVHTKQYALVLQFYMRNQPPTFTLTPGVITHAELVFFRSSVPLRALIKQQFNTKSASQIQGFNNWSEVASRETSYNQKNPFVNTYVFVVENMKPVQHNNQWWLHDNQKQMMRISDRFTNMWKLLSISGGRELSLTITGKENDYVPVGAWHNGVYKLL